MIRVPPRLAYRRAGSYLVGLKHGSELGEWSGVPQRSEAPVEARLSTARLPTAPDYPCRPMHP